jgi:hypothetical protein
LARNGGKEKEDDFAWDNKDFLYNDGDGGDIEEIKRELIQARQAAKSQGKMPAEIE